MKNSRRYVCALCGRLLNYSSETGGLGTWRCPDHPSRSLTVVRDLSGGHESGRANREVPVTVERHTKARVEFT